MTNDRGESQSRSNCASPCKFKRNRGSCGNGGRLLHFLDPNHENRAATLMESDCGGNRDGLSIGALLRRSNVVNNALVDLLHNGRRVGLG